MDIVDRCYPKVFAGVAPEAGQVPRGGGALDILSLVCTSVEEHPAVAVVEALALVGQLDAALVEDGLEHLGTVALDSGVETAVARIAYTLTNLNKCIPCLIQMVGTAGCLCKVQQYLGIAHGNQGLTVTGKT